MIIYSTLVGELLRVNEYSEHGKCFDFCLLLAIEVQPFWAIGNSMTSHHRINRSCSVERSYCPSMGVMADALCGQAEQSLEPSYLLNVQPRGFFDLYASSVANN